MTDNEVLQYLKLRQLRLAHEIELDRQASGELHYADLLRLAQVVLQIEPVARLYQHHYGAVLVDEFQDLTPQQLDIVLRTCTERRTFAGDQLQGIYSWAGAKPIQVAGDLAVLCDHHVALTRSYRSSPAVLGAVNTVARDLGSLQVLSSHDPSAWPGGGYASAIAFGDERQESQAILELSRALSISRPQWSLGIVTRSVWRAREVDDAFSASGVPLTHWDTPIESPEVLAVLQDALDRYPASAAVTSVRDLILANLDTEDPDHLSDVEAALESLASTNAPNFGAAARSLRIAEDTRPVQPGAHLLNAHRGKGHQFDWVVVLGLEEKHLPDGRSIDEEALREEQQILLVMLSRARHGAVVTRRIQTVAPWGTHRPRASRWWPLFDEIRQPDIEAVLAHVASLGNAVPGPATVESGG